MLVGFSAAVLVLIKGLGLTNLTDLVPWGLWITIDLSSIALSAGAFSLCAAVYLAGLKEFYPVARTATYIGFIGYSMAMMCLLMDIGRPDRFWHGFVFWNPHSVLWEVTMCVGLYFTVLTLEVLPIVGKANWFKGRFPKVAEIFSHVHHYAPYLAIVGLILSMLHQSSLGATYGVLQARTIWYSPSLSFLFMFSAIIGGISLTILISMLAGRYHKKSNIKENLLDRLSLLIGWGLIVYLYFRFWYLFSMTYTYQVGQTEGLKLLFSGPLAVTFWFGEVLLGAIVPIVILLKSSWRSHFLARSAALGLIVIGVISYRWNLNLSGQLILLASNPIGIQVLFTQYTPSLIEILVGLGVVSYGVIAILFGIEFLGIVDHGVPSKKIINDKNRVYQWPAETAEEHT
jgi:Ni/Fe-hydrogenase subunit HybB-like protein